MKKTVRVIAVSVAVSCVLLCSAMAAKKPLGWVHVRTGKLFGISGMVLLNGSQKKAELLIIHDNKKQGQGRLALVELSSSGKLDFTPIDWAKGHQTPYDAESLTAIPGKKNEYLTSESKGKVTHLKVDAKRKKVEILGKFRLPTVGSGHNYEAFTLQKVNNTLIAAWGHRGKATKPAKLFWATLDLEGYKVGAHKSIDILIPWPTGPVRHISDLIITEDGILYGSAASDPGDAGPFSCAVYKHGSFTVQDGSISFNKLEKPVELYRNDKHKAEALILIDEKRFAAGSDDETAGSAVYVSWF